MSRPLLERTSSVAGVQQQEVAGAVGVLRLARGQAHLADHGGLLVAEHAGSGTSPPTGPTARVCPYGVGCRGRADLAAASAAGCRRSASSSSSQSSVSRFISMVRLALVTSVTCTPPSDPAGEVPQQPGVGGAEQRVPRSAASRTPSTFSRIHWILPAGEVRRRRQPGPVPDDVAAAVPRRARLASRSVRVSCQTIAL